MCLRDKLFMGILEMLDVIWYRNVRVLWQNSAITHFFPTKSMSPAQQLNAVQRFFIYYAIVTAVLTRNPKYIVLILVGALVTILIHESTVASRLRGEKFGTPECQPPTPSNPFMNKAVYDESDRKPACKHWHLGANQINDAIGGVIPHDGLGHQTSFDRFYTMPSTEMVSDQGGFANWLYGTREST